MRTMPLFVVAALAACDASPEVGPRLSPVDLAAPPPTLLLDGDCPGTVDIDVLGATPGGSVSLYWAATTGAAVLGSGPCTGRITNLGGSPFRVGGVTASAAGTAGGPLPVPAGACGGHFQVVDEASCTLSDAKLIVPNTGGPMAVALTPSAPSACADLVCDLVVAPPDNGVPYFYDVAWTRNGVAYFGTTTDGDLPGDTVPASETAAGDVWACAVQANDGSGPIVASSASVTVGTGQVVEGFTMRQSSVGSADVLIVVDNSGSMAEEQSKLANVAPTLFAQAQASGVDVHLGVVSTDVLQATESGRLQDGLGYRFVTDATPNGGAALADALLLGTSGSYVEAGMDATYLALSEPLRSGYNAGFRRADADFAMFVISDEDDQSAGNGIGIDNRNEFNGFLAQEASVHGVNVTAWPLVGDQAFGCTSASTSAVPGARYLTTVDAFGGLSGSICAEDFTSYLTLAMGVVTGKPRHVVPSQAPEPGSLEVLAVLPNGVSFALPTSFYAVDDASGAIVFGASPPDGTEVWVRYDPVCDAVPVP